MKFKQFLTESSGQVYVLLIGDYSDWQPHEIVAETRFFSTDSKRKQFLYTAWKEALDALFDDNPNVKRDWESSSSSDVVDEILFNAKYEEYFSSHASAYPDILRDEVYLDIVIMDDMRHT